MFHRQRNSSVIKTLLFYIHISLLFGCDLEASFTSSPSTIGDTTNRTKVYHGSKRVIEAELRFLLNAKRNVDTCMNYTSLLLAIRTEAIKKSLMDAKRRGVKIRYLTEITKDNLRCSHELMDIVEEVRHLEGFMNNFMVSESEYLAPVVFDGQTKIAPKIIYCNISSFVEQQQYFFDMLWNKAETADERIREIKDGIKPDFIETIRDPYEVQKLVFELINGANKEILGMFSTANAFRRQTESGAVRLLKKASLRGLKVRILTPFDEKVEKIMKEELGADDNSKASTNGNMVNHDKDKQKQDDHPNNINKLRIRFIQPQLQTKVSMLVVDRKYSLVAELKDDSKDTSVEAIGLTSYSNSKSTVSSYVSILDSLWAQLDLYEQVKESNKQQEILIKKLQLHDTLQEEFINVAAHELRTPIQPILGLTDILENKNGNIEQYKEIIPVIGRNARRLKHLTEDILDVSRIDGNSLELRSEVFDLVSIINGLLDDYRKDQAGLVNRPEISFECNVENASVLGDRQRISQVIQNLLDNAFNFTKDGLITISVSRKTQNTYTNEWIIIVKDSGKGIDLEMMPRLFTKFATKSLHGIGLGLYISKSIIEAHGGRIWGKNNADGKGATFSFSLPTTN
jgi:two-component system sensor histidine kinase VicK